MDYIFALLILLLPSYTERFTISGQPLNVLMAANILVWVIFALWLLFTRQVGKFFQSMVSNPRILILAAALLLAGAIGVFVAGLDQQSLGAFIVLFVQPIGTFFIVRYYRKTHPEAREYLSWILLMYVAIFGVIAAIQYKTLWHLPMGYWGNAQEPKRAIALFGHPNFYALFVAPVLAFLLPLLRKYLLEKKRIALSFATLFWVIGAFGLLLSLSRAGWVGLAAAIGIFAIIAGTKHIRLAVLAIGVLAIVFVFLNVNLRYRVLLPFHGEKSAVSRVSLWGTGLKAIKENPVFGKGLTGFARNWDRLNTDPNIDRHNYPHNVFLNFWVETGLLGLISFILLSLFVVICGYQNRSNTYALGIALFVITLLVQGMFDNPYFKNDLAMLFWMVLALGL